MEERKNEARKHFGICRKLLNFVLENFRFHASKRVTLGRPNPSTGTREEESNSRMRTGEGSQFDKAVIEESEVALVPPIQVVKDREVSLVPPIQVIPVERLDTMPEDPKRRSNQDNHEVKKKKKKKLVWIKSWSKDDKGKEIIVKSNPSMEKVDERKEESSACEKSPEKGEEAVMSKKPVPSSASNINEKFDSFIRERKESFATEKELLASEQP